MVDTVTVFDFESYPDYNVLANLVGKDSPILQEPDPIKAYLVSENKIKDDEENYFAPLVFHKIITVSLLCAKIVRDMNGMESHYVAETLVSSSEDEYTLLQKLLGYLGTGTRRIVTYNGRTFELPLLRARAMRHKLVYPLDKYGTRYDNYESRYSHGYHADIGDMLSRYGAARMPKLGEAAALINVPGKILTTGHHVKALYDSGDLETIRQYCELDSLLTYIIWLHYQYTSGLLTDAGYTSSLTSLLACIKKQNKPHTNLFLEKWYALDSYLELYKPLEFVSS